MRRPVLLLALLAAAAPAAFAQVNECTAATKVQRYWANLTELPAPARSEPGGDAEEPEEADGQPGQQAVRVPPVKGTMTAVVRVTPKCKGECSGLVELSFAGPAPPQQGNRSSQPPPPVTRTVAREAWTSEKRVAVDVHVKTVELQCASSALCMPEVVEVEKTTCAEAPPVQQPPSDTPNGRDDN